MQANLFAYNAALGACEQSGRWQEAVLLLKAVRGVRICCPFQGPESRQCHGLTCAQRVPSCQELSEEHLQGDMISFCAGFGACRKTERWEFALPLSKGLRGQLKFLMARAAGAAGAASIR